jgi:hypothetical protein
MPGDFRALDDKQTNRYQLVVETCVRIITMLSPIAEGAST